MQVDPIKPKLKAPGTQRLNQKFDKPLSSFAFKFNLRHYTMEDLQTFEPGSFVDALFPDSA